MAQYEIGQAKLVDLHEYTYYIDMNALLSKVPDVIRKTISDINKLLFQKSLYSTNRMNDYEK